ncbi:hypothetical protein MFRU_004g00290 [Monilinia fructicola]|nr:hypothetical protein MFRU_004g00290 [Monilinia fructicola]
MVEVACDTVIPNITQSQARSASISFVSQNTSLRLRDIDDPCLAIRQAVDCYYRRSHVHGVWILEPVYSERLPDYLRNIRDCSDNVPNRFFATSTFNLSQIKENRTSTCRKENTEEPLVKREISRPRLTRTTLYGPFPTCQRRQFLGPFIK